MSVSELIHYCESCAGECERVVRLKYERTGLIVEMEILAAENDRLTAQRDALYAALKVFANLDISHHDGKPDDRPVFGLNETVFTLGDVRRARAALSLVNQEKA